MTDNKSLSLLCVSLRKRVKSIPQNIDLLYDCFSNCTDKPFASVYLLLQIMCKLFPLVFNTMLTSQRTCLKIITKSKWNNKISGNLEHLKMSALNISLWTARVNVLFQSCDNHLYNDFTRRFIEMTTQKHIQAKISITGSRWQFNSSTNYDNVDIRTKKMIHMIHNEEYLSELQAHELQCY